MSDFQTVKDMLTMRQVAEGYGFKVNRGNFMQCPFHSDKTASVKIYEGSRGFHCFGCHAGGSVIDFTSRLFGITAKEALERLVSDFGLPVQISTLKEFRVRQGKLETLEERFSRMVQEIYAKKWDVEGLLRHYEAIEGVNEAMNRLRWGGGKAG